MSIWIALFGLAAGHVVASFVQTYFHRVLGHGEIGGWIRALHVGEHHTIYSGKRLETTRYSEEKSLTLVYLLASLLMLPAFLVLPRAMAVGFSAGLLLSYFAHIYLHAQYHLSNSPLRHRAWFCRMRALHMVHHRRQDRNFAVIDLYWDKLMGTFAGAEPREGVDPQ